MTLFELKQDIMQNKLKHFYVFVGDEIGIMKIYLAEMSNKIRLPIKRIENIQEIYGNLGGSLFGGDNFLYVARDDKDFIKSDANVVNDLGGSYLVLLCSATDSRLKFFKTHKDETVEFEKLPETVLKKYIQKVCPLNDSNANSLCEVTNGSYDVAMLECDKINQYADYCKVSENESFNVLLREGVVYKQEQYDVFQFVDAVMRKQKRQAFHIASFLSNNGVASVNILGTLYQAIKNVLLVQVCESDDVENTTGLDSKQVYFTKKNVGKFSTQKLIQGIHMIADVVNGVKSGLIEDQYATNYVLVNLL